MGADIYLNSEYKKCEAKWQPIFQKAVAERDALTRIIENEYRWGQRRATSGKTLDQLVREDSRFVSAQAKVTEAYDNMYSEGYFRDSYNDGSLFWLLGLSWWKLAESYVNKQSELPLYAAKRLLTTLTKGKGQFTDEKFEEWVAKRRADDWKFEGDDTTDAWKAAFIERHARFVAMLEKSLKLKEPLYWSV